jgi:putative glutamine amidotransferase
MSKPIIGIVVWRRGMKTPLGDPEYLHSLSDEYVGSISDAGGAPLLIPARRPLDEAGAILDRIDGLVFSGGTDVDPASYGAENTDSKGVDRVVDVWEIELIERARRRRVPTLAICRGVQILNVAHGGTLQQEILGEGEIHHPLGGSSAEEILSDGHPVALTPSGRLARIYGTTSIDVNSIHHQAIDALGQELEVEGVTSDGVVEAVASTDPRWWAIGVQWHPERTLNDVDKPLFDAFVIEAKG